VLIELGVVEQRHQTVLEVLGGDRRHVCEQVVAPSRFDLSGDGIQGRRTASH
jgi:hypothetical protein